MFVHDMNRVSIIFPFQALILSLKKWSWQPYAYFYSNAWILRHYSIFHFQINFKTNRYTYQILKKITKIISIRARRRTTNDVIGRLKWIIEYLKNVICKRPIYSEKSSALKITLLSNIPNIKCRLYVRQCKVSFAIMRYFHVKLRCIYWIPFFLVFFVESSIENHQFYIKNHRISNKISISSWSKK